MAKISGNITKRLADELRAITLLHDTFDEGLGGWDTIFDYGGTTYKTGYIARSFRFASKGKASLEIYAAAGQSAYVTKAVPFPMLPSYSQTEGKKAQLDLDFLIFNAYGNSTWEAAAYLDIGLILLKNKTAWTVRTRLQPLTNERVYYLDPDTGAYVTIASDLDIQFSEAKFRDEGYQNLITGYRTQGWNHLRLTADFLNNLQGDIEVNNRKFPTPKKHINQGSSIYWHSGCLTVLLGLAAGSTYPHRAWFDNILMRLV